MGECPAYNPFSADVLDDPFAAYADARGQCPVHYFADHEPGFYTAFTHADVVKIAMKREDWTARYGLSPRFQRGVGFNTDGSEHLKFRKAVVAGLGPRNVDALEPAIKAIVDDLLDKMIEHGPGDFHDLFAGPLPLIVIARLLGLEGDLGRFKELSDALMAEGMNSTDPRGFNQVLAELDRYWVEQLAPRKAALATVDQPGPEHLGTLLPDDMMSNLLIVRTAEGEPLTDFEISNTLMNLLLAGNETTISLLTNLVWRLLEEPTRWAALLEDRTLVETAIEESLRFDAPVLGMFRTSERDVELSGTAIPAKSKIMAAYGAANRDPQVFADPDEFRLDRAKAELRAHLAFGRGPHACPGAALSRLEARIAINAILDRLPTLRLDGPSTRIEPFNFWGRRTLPVAW
ncbi:cytochrome P450 [Nocardia gipuzkoensis]|uniref:cytochrome P450 n=1 Tax=Nocardia gipuzkoensis TaxID=2749991 RepID=UPI001E361957|nr:cytochrome P450 [Nocardia gipuzkoensis]UGT67863.1 cytochrome P450 [Nocardia gipuzkoensis]